MTALTTGAKIAYALSAVGLAVFLTAAWVRFQDARERRRG